MKRNQLAEQNYYNNSDLWSLDNQIDEYEELRIEENIKIIPSSVNSLVDVGAGIGLFLSKAEKTYASMDLFGVERSLTAIEASQCITKIVQGSINNLPLDDCSVDLVTAQAVIEHLPYYEYKKSLIELERVAKKYILIDVPYCERRLRAICPKCNCEFSPHFHMRSFNKEILLNLFNTFRIIKMVEVPRKDSILSAVMRPYRNHIFSDYPDYTICPQCGFKNNKHINDNDKKNHTNKINIKDIIRNISNKMPKVKVPGHILVLYEKEAC